MLPKNSKHFIQPTADKLDVDPDLVDDAVHFFYAEVRRNLVEMTGPNIQIENLGSFRAKKNELPKLVAKYTKHLDVLKPDTFNQVKLKKNLELKLERVLGLQKQMDEERRRKTEFKQNKDEQRNAKQNMEQSDGNS
jgi:nucleoid DNA-binding protein